MSSIQNSIFTSLSAEDLRFVELFVLSRGNIKEMERELGLSYWTIRGKLNDIVEFLERVRKAQTLVTEQKLTRLDVLKGLEDGELSVDEAEVMLAHIKKGLR